MCFVCIIQFLQNVQLEQHTITVCFSPLPQIILLSDITCGAWVTRLPKSSPAELFFFARLLSSSNNIYHRRPQRCIPVHPVPQSAIAFSTLSFWLLRASRLPVLHHSRKASCSYWHLTESTTRNSRPGLSGFRVGQATPEIVV